ATRFQRVQIPAGGWSPMVSETELIPGTPVGVRIGRVWTDNALPIVFGPSTAAWTTQELRYGALFDAPAGGNCLAYLDVHGPFGAIPVNKTLTFPAHSLKLRLQDTAYTDTFTPGARYLVGEFTRQIKEYLLKHLTGQASYLSGSRWFALGGGNAVDTHLGTFTEITGSGYGRAATATHWGAPTQTAGPSLIQLSADLPFPAAGADWPQGSLILLDAASGGNLVARFGFSLVSSG